MGHMVPFSLVLATLITCVTRPALTAMIWRNASTAISQLYNVDYSEGALPVVVHGGSVWLFNHKTNNLQEIDPMTNTLTVYNPGIDLLPSWGQLYCQSQSVVFMTTIHIRTIIGYNLQSKTQTYDIPKHPLNTEDSGGCITANDQYLISVGGSNPVAGTFVDSVFIYTFTAAEWSIGAPLREGRDGGGCNIVDQHVYYISGRDESAAKLTSILFLSINDIFSGAPWNLFPSRLTLGRIHLRSVTFQHFIYVVGGIMLPDGYTTTSNVDVVDTMEGTITEETPMLYPKCRNSVVILDGVLYSFSGSPITNNQYYQYAVIPTMNPSMSPSSNPSPSPTTPTVNPSVDPTAVTLNPTMHPTSNPSNAPSLPTIIPTKAPTHHPSLFPIMSPTLKASARPTLYPITPSPTASPFDTEMWNTYTSKPPPDSVENVDSSNRGVGTIVLLIVCGLLFIATVVATIQYMRLKKTQKQVEGTMAEQSQPTGARPSVTAPTRVIVASVSDLLEVEPGAVELQQSDACETKANDDNADDDDDSLYGGGEEEETAGATTTTRGETPKVYNGPHAHTRRGVSNNVTLGGNSTQGA